MIEIRQYRPEDYLKITRRQFDMVTFENYANPERVAHMLVRGDSYTMTANEEIVACAGVIPYWNGVGEAWCVSSPLVTKYRKTFAKTVHDKLSEIIKKHGYERVQTCVHADFIISQKWAERMGFRSEGLMRKYIGGQDYIRYAWIKES